MMYMKFSIRTRTKAVMMPDMNTATVKVPHIIIVTEVAMLLHLSPFVKTI